MNSDESSTPSITQTVSLSRMGELLWPAFLATVIVSLIAAAGRHESLLHSTAGSLCCLGGVLLFTVVIRAPRGFLTQLDQKGKRTIALFGGCVALIAGATSVRASTSPPEEPIAAARCDDLYRTSYEAQGTVFNVEGPHATARRFLHDTRAALAGPTCTNRAWLRALSSTSESAHEALVQYYRQRAELPTKATVTIDALTEQSAGADIWDFEWIEHTTPRRGAPSFERYRARIRLQATGGEHAWQVDAFSWSPAPHGQDVRDNGSHEP